MQSRKHGDWIEGFLAFTSGLPSPEILRKWAAISCIAGALEQKVWVSPFGPRLFPNLYVVLVGPPGVGKTVAASETGHFWRDLPNHHVSPTSVSKASLIDSLVDSKRQLVRPGKVPPFVEFHSINALSGELGVLIPGYDNEFMNTLTDLYDCNPYVERKRTKDVKISIQHPQINLLAATTPSYLGALLPEGAWTQGFISRTLLIYSGEAIITPMFSRNSLDDTFYKSLLSDLKIIGDYYGPVGFSDDAATAISAWHANPNKPTPEHPKLISYITRRTSHLLKLCMVAAASAGDGLEVTLQHYQTALDWLTEAESYMPDIFRSMRSGGDSSAIEEAFYFVLQTFAKEKKPVIESRLVGFLRERVPAHNVLRVIEIMVKSNMLKSAPAGHFMGYLPGNKVEF